MQRQGMTHAPKPDRNPAPASNDDRVSAAARVLARLLARQAAVEFRNEREHGEERSDHDPQDDQAG